MATHLNIWLLYMIFVFLQGLLTSGTGFFLTKFWGGVHTVLVVQRLKAE
jgi:hypothetical protein